MKTKIYIIIAFLILGISVIQAQIKGQVQSTQKSVSIVRVNNFDRIISDALFYTEDSGSPELPVVLKSYLIPLNADKVTVNINKVSKQKLEGQYTIYPAQPQILLTNHVESISFTEPNKSVYESKDPFPNKLTDIVSDELYLGYRIVTIRLYPFEYIPQEKVLYICNIDFSIDYILNKQTKSEHITQNQSLYRYELNKRAIKFRVENPEMVDNYDTKVRNIIEGKNIVKTNVSEGSTLRSASLSVLDEQIPEYVIITCDSLKAAFQPLSDWKTKKGIFSIIQTMEEIAQNYQGSDIQEKNS